MSVNSLPMRIAQFTESYRPVINGAAVAVDAIADAQAEEHHVEVFAPHFPGHVDTKIVHRFPSYSFPGHRDYPLAFPFSASIGRHFRKAGFEVIHTHSPFALGQVGRRWARRHGIPLVTTYHTLYVEYAHYAKGIPPSLSRAYLKSLTRRYCNACDAVAVPTSPIRDVLHEYGVTRPIKVIPTGLKLAPPPPRDRSSLQERWSIPLEAPVALYAGRLAQEKNLELLFASFARVGRALPEAWLLVAGDGPHRAVCERWARESGVGERIVFAGFVAQEEMPRIYASADVFAFCSRTDTQGLVLIEAKAAGLPVVSVGAFGPTEVVTDGVDGFLVPDDAEAFSAALLRVLQDAELRQSMSDSALREVRRFSIEETARAYLRLYEAARESQSTG
jgi:1,2-diacylglycerol 3-alpha-glucosyltransferase